MTATTKETKFETKLISIPIHRISTGNLLNRMSGKPASESGSLGAVMFDHMVIDGQVVSEDYVLFTTTSAREPSGQDCRVVELIQASNKDHVISIHLNLTTGEYTASNAWGIPTDNVRIYVFLGVSRFYEVDVAVEELPGEVYHAEEAALKLATHRHYKGGLYRKLYDGQHSEDKDADGKPIKYVAYEHLFPHEQGIWVRPAELFYGQLEDGSPRFEVLNPQPYWVISSTSEAKGKEDFDGAYWNAKLGWVQSQKCATRYSGDDSTAVPLPPSAGNDAQWCLVMRTARQNKHSEESK